MCDIAFGGEGGGAAKRTLESLERKGLIKRVERQDDSGGLLCRWHVWTMPLPIHINFCAWCSKQGRCPDESD